MTAALNTQATVMPVKSQAKQALGTTVNIPPRRMDFNFDAVNAPRYFYGNDPFLSIFWDTFSSLLPEGESFFVEAVRHYRDQITDPTLKAQVAGFIGQEAMHSKEHDAFNAMLRAKGFPVDKLDHDVGQLLKFAQKILPKSMCLAATVCLEHYTAIMAEQLLRDKNHQAMMKDPEALKMWLWHALEENEHKTVAYDVYEQVVGSYHLRTFTMIPTTIILFAVMAYFQARLLAADGQLFNVRQNVKGFRFLFGYKKGLFPKLIPQFFDFFRKDFHPSQHDTNALLDQWRTLLFSKEEGLLYQQVKNKAAVGLH
jgi:predicted metal-dependent hydrolase